MKFSVGGKEVGFGNPVYIVADMAWSHDGSLENAKKIVIAAAKAKADAICLHITSLPDYMVKNYKTTEGGASRAAVQNLYDFLSEKNLCEKDWVEIISLADSLHLSILAMCNDIPSVEFAAVQGVDAFVLSPASISEKSLIYKIAKYQKPVLVRTGGATLTEIENVINDFKSEGVPNICLVHGFQGFPTEAKEMNLNMISFLKKAFSLPVGFADHIDANSELALIIPLIAVAKGADLIEKHITYNRSLRGLDYESALNPEEFAKMVKNIREIETSFGESRWVPLSDRERRYREAVRKRAVALKEITKGEKLSVGNVAFKRANNGLFPEEFELIKGRKTKRNLTRDEPITWNCVE
ncbi:MAG: N-acetylneuraminate synthase family protein [Candidatus Anstonellales archaeon]